MTGFSQFRTYLSDIKPSLKLEVPIMTKQVQAKTAAAEYLREDQSVPLKGF